MRVFQIDTTPEIIEHNYRATQTRCLFIKGHFIVVEYSSAFAIKPSDWQELIINIVDETRVLGEYQFYRRAIEDWRKDQRIKALVDGYKLYEANYLYEDNAGKRYGIFTRRNIVDMVSYSELLRNKLQEFESFLESEYREDILLRRLLLKQATDLASVNYIRFTDREIHASMDKMCNSIKNHINA